MAALGLWSVVLVAAGLDGCQSLPARDGAAAPVAAIPAVPVAANPPVAPTLLAKARSIPSASIMGLDRGAIRKLLGEPHLIRRDEPAEVWQYQTTSCVLDLVLYKQANRSRVVYAEARTPKADPTPTDNCLGEVAAKRKPLSSS